MEKDYAVVSIHYEWRSTYVCRNIPDLSQRRMEAMDMGFCLALYTAIGSLMTNISIL